MAWHRANMAFAAYPQTYLPACKHLASSLPGGLEKVQAIIDQDIERETNHGKYRLEKLRRTGACSTANVSADDLIRSFDGDVGLLLAKARRLLRHCDDGGDVQQCAGGQAACRLPSTRVVALEATLGGTPAMSRGSNVFDFSSAPGGHWDLWAFTLAFAYHKLVPICSRSDPVDPETGAVVRSKPNFVCTSDEIERGEASGDHEGQVVYDLLPINPERGYCHGTSCGRAVDALDAHKRLMHVVTPFRTALLKSLVQRTCPCVPRYLPHSVGSSSPSHVIFPRRVQV